MSIKQQGGVYLVQQDGIYEHTVTHDRFKMRKGQVVPEGDANHLKRTDPWPGDTDEEELEVAATGKARSAPANKMAEDPENKSR